ncbi:unnamed protein product [Cuscuta europaea]|uniref:ACT domain-containing protein ACR n=1 Tax=Cuscuta europaea TaxID=41803 RepID=A0A9P0YRP1_CUSEU|nr:unnamed protein product [Cuscuta europaea]
MPTDDAVVIQKGNRTGDPYMITVNCPDKTGLGCDICRTLLEFGLYVRKGDFSTDGIWCYVVLWVSPQSYTPTVRWANLKERLLSICPTCTSLLYLYPPCPSAPTSSIYLLTFCCLDRRGLLHDVTRFLCELELSIERVKVTTTPDGRVVDLFFIKDNLELLNIKGKQEEICERLCGVVGESCLSCELKLAGQEFENYQYISALCPSDAEKLFQCELSEKETRYTQAPTPDVMKTSVVVDNSLSPAHTLLQISCTDHKGFLYDIMRTLKDCYIQIAYGRSSEANKGQRELDLFIQQKDGKKILDAQKQAALCSRLKVELLHPLPVIISNRGPDTELLVANPVELSGRGRPRVFYDVTYSLKTLGICIFSAEIGRHSTLDREWEVYKFLLDENCDFDLSTVVCRNTIVDRVRRTLMGW